MMIKGCLGLWLSIFFCGVLCIQYEILPYNPVANPNAVVVSGNARFTVLTPNIIRMEYAKSGKFEDRATVAFVNRNVPVPTFTKTINSTDVIIKTSALELKYKVGSVFSQTSLTITGLDSNTGFTSWYYGQPNPRNLLGTIKSLDLLGVTSLNCDQIQNVVVNGESLHCEWGLISRDGWTVVNDTTNYGLDNTFWWDSPNTDDLDLYFFGHGLNYKQALSDYTLLGGKIAMVPRYIYGIAWSRWYNLNNVDVTSIVNEYLTRYLPLDVYILDMDWHVKYAWGAYSWDKRLFPYPNHMLSWLQSQGLAVSANLHDADGVHPYEDQYTQMCNALGINPSSGQSILFSSVNATYLTALDDVVLGPIMDQGMDFWWIDWQQGGTTGGCTGQKQNPTYILDHLRSTYHLRHDQDVRGLVLARWGGLGTHRYQVGFSGDVAAVTWANLAFQPYFSWTASNVGYGFWSHDIVGPHDNHELHTRWIQWGAYSGIFRTHDRGMAAGGCSDTGNCPIVEVWNVLDPYFSVNRAAMLERASLIPYIYTAARQAFDTGISLIRPMYYEYPQYDYAYKGDENGNFGQYFFGDDMFVAPITSPASSSTNMANSTIWIPPGIWIEKDTGVMIGASDGTTTLTKSFDLSEIPVFIRGGAIIPKISLPPGNTIATARRQYTTLRLQIYPGQPSGTTRLYEDDGISMEYLNSNKYSWTQISYLRTPTNLQIVIYTPNGTFPELPTARSYIIEVINGLPLNSGTVNGNPLVYSSFDVPNSWRYDGDSVTLRVLTPILPTNNIVTIVLNTPAINDKLMSGIKGAIQKSILAKRNLDPDWGTPGCFSVSGGYLSMAASVGFELSYLAGTDINTFYQVLNSVPQLFLNATNEIMGIKPIPPPPAGSLAQLWDADRQDNILCGSTGCLNDNSQYQLLRIEGYQPAQGSPDTVSLNDFWNADINDNYATTQTTTPNGYSTAGFSDGIVYSKSKPGTLPLSVWWNSQRQDMLTVASAEGLAYAKQYGYTLVNATVGYVLTSPPTSNNKGAIPLTRWAYSMELLNNALN